LADISPQRGDKKSPFEGRFRGMYSKSCPEPCTELVKVLKKERILGMSSMMI